MGDIFRGVSPKCPKTARSLNPASGSDHFGRGTRAIYKRKRQFFRRALAGYLDHDHHSKFHHWNIGDGFI